MFNAVDGPSYCVYTQAYGMEMQVNDEWPLNILMMAPPHLVSSMTTEADIASMGMIPGASYTPGDGDFKQITNNGGQWVLARPSDNIPEIIAHKLGVLLLIEDASDLEVLAGVDNLTSSNLVVAFPIERDAYGDDATAVANEIRGRLNEDCRAAQILVSGSTEHPELRDFPSAEGVSGILLLDASFDTILEVVHEIVG